MTSIAICDYGAGNIRSLRGALRRAGFHPSVTSEPAAIRAAQWAILPGVGSAKSAMEALHAAGLDTALQERHEAGHPTLGICLGLQLAGEMSDEDGGVECLGLLAGRAVRVKGGRVPRMGWAMVDPWNETFYFAHSYVLDSPDTVATSEGLCAAARQDAFVGVQFHPEKSGPAGERWLRECLSRA